METCTSLGDSTVIAIDKHHPKRWKPFNETLLIAVIVAMFPEMEMVFDDLMVIPDMYDLEAFLSATLALHQVFVQHGSIPESMGDSFFAASQFAECYTYFLSGDQIYPGQSRKQPRERVQFTVSPEAVKHLAFLVSDCEQFEAPIPQEDDTPPEDTVQINEPVVDISPPIASSDDLIYKVDPVLPVCEENCQVCLFSEEHLPFVDVRLLQHPPGCKRFVVEPPPLVSVFNELFQHQPPGIFCYGSSFLCRSDPVPFHPSRVRFIGPVLFHSLPDRRRPRSSRNGRVSDYTHRARKRQ